MEKVIFRSNKSGYTKTATAKVCPKCTIACWRSYSVGCSVQKSGEDRFLFTRGCSLWQNKLLENLEQSTFSSMKFEIINEKLCWVSALCHFVILTSIWSRKKKMVK